MSPSPRRCCRITASIGVKEFRREDTIARLYFAYGANLDREAMRDRAPEALFMGIGRIPGWRVVLAKSGYASIEPWPAGRVEGAIWQIQESDESALDEFEEIRQGLYVKGELTAETGSGVKPVLVYIESGRLERNEATGSDPEYLENVILAAESLGLTESYLAELRALRSK